ncbi:hypothetical protein PMAYCL1PPCAC_02715 [Pristionchus mayeri]|uniref:Uncharacterized protein n=1 Tax=Pristionchus mayeri TaxID=1317129 RepID=A0AAN4Z8M7_9BILA|nr:hypothetical protein PMAYCL1PPCAC_02715 [Pristionchus mayeri]
MLPSSASYSIPDGRYQSSSSICCGLFPIKVVARVVALYILITCLLLSSLSFFKYGLNEIVFTIVCVLFTLHASSLVYGVFRENRTALVPFLVFQGIGIVLCIFAFFSFLLLGLTTSFISDQHIHNEELRELYERQGWNPDDQRVQRVGTLTLGLFALLNILLQLLCWWSILSHYNHLDPSRDREIRYSKGVLTPSNATSLKDDGF